MKEERKGFKYVYTEEKFKAYKDTPAWQKLAWLEEMNRFLYDFMPEKSKIIREKIRTGEI